MAGECQQRQRGNCSEGRERTGCQSDGAEADSRVSFKKMQINTCKLTDDVKQRKQKRRNQRKSSRSLQRGKPPR